MQVDVDAVSGVFVPVELAAAEWGVPEGEVIDGIKRGLRAGRLVEVGWQVLVPMRVAERAVEVSFPEVMDVAVRDVEMGFAAMVTFMMKWTLAAVPALALLAGACWGLVSIAGAVGGLLG